MSLLNQRTHTVTVFREVTTTDGDGNTISIPSEIGVSSGARIQQLSSVEDNDGRTTTRYRLRLVGWKGAPLGARSAIEWNGKRYAIDGEPLDYNGSHRTANVEYTMVRR